MNKKVFYLTVLTLSASGVSSFASDGYVVSKNNPCAYENGQPVSGTSELINCAAQRKNDQELALKEVWTCVLSKYEPKGSDGYKSLLIEQKNWEKFRASACQSYTYDFGREGHMQFQSCLETLTKERVVYLNHFLYPSNEEKCLDKYL